VAVSAIQALALREPAILRFMGVVRFCAVALVAVVLAGCGGGASDKSTVADASGRSSPVAAPTASVLDGEIAAAAEQLVRDNWSETPEDFGKPYEGPFLAFKCSEQMIATQPQDCWVPWINGFSYSDGTLKVVLQVDRTDPASRLWAERAARWFRNFISADFDGILRPNVKEIVITDGTGAKMAQERALG